MKTQNRRESLILPECDGRAIASPPQTPLETRVSLRNWVSDTVPLQRCTLVILSRRRCVQLFQRCNFIQTKQRRDA
ncbi:MAG TPA: hypothetical protein DCZ55_09120 [Cyanobacteria bacterium UBA11371]|nr:hypothetical protein [Cyanobacteria bacterium UBA11371]